MNITQGLAAALQFDCNLWMLLAIVHIIRKDFTIDNSKMYDALFVIDFIMQKTFQPFIWCLTCVLPHKSDEQHRKTAPFLFLAILIPFKIIAVRALRDY